MILSNYIVTEVLECSRYSITNNGTAKVTYCMSMEREPDGQVRRLQDLHVSLANE